MRHRGSRIGALQVGELVHVSHDAKVDAVTAFYRGLMGSHGAPRWSFSLQQLYSGQSAIVGDLDRVFEESEVAVAVKGMNKHSAPGPDGFGPSFYGAAWDQIKTVVMAMVLAFCDGSADLERVNRSYLVLLPKKPGAQMVTDFRPICLQNCSVKILSKVLTTRLQGIISGMIDLDQTGFLKGRSIAENFVYAMELVQCCHKRKLPTLVLKLDFAKAFDTVHWSALLDILAARGFSQKWMAWIHHLLASSKTAVLLNGCPGPWFGCRRGLRQGDPISPYLFLLVADVLQRLIKEDPVFRHPVQPELPGAVLQYADDTLIVMQGTAAVVARLAVLLEQFSEATGLSINYSKSVLVPLHMTEPDVQSCVGILGCRREGFPQTYLGLPLSNTKLRLNAFAPLIAKADKYLAGWQAALLNSMGRLVLVNAVLDSQLIYHMSSLLLAPGVIKLVDKRRRGFLWSGKGQTTGAKSLVAWEDVQRSKEAGGLGVKKLPLHNVCLLLKLLHRLHMADSSSWAIWVRGQVCLANLKGPLAGDHWDVLRSLLPYYRAVTTSTVHDGKGTSFWHDVWCGEDDLATRFPVLLSHVRVKEEEASVRDVLDRGLRSMLMPRVSAQATEELLAVDSITNSWTLSAAPDTRDCFAAADGKLQAGVIYHALCTGDGEMDAAAKFIWKNCAPPRVRFFGWLARRGRIQCRANLVIKKVVENGECEVCHAGEETTSHILFHCSFAKQLWDHLQVSPPQHSHIALLHLVPRPPSLPALHFNTFVLLCCWSLWKRRNRQVFDGEMMSLQTFLSATRAEAQLWRHRMKPDDHWVVDVWCACLSMAM